MDLPALPRGEHSRLVRFFTLLPGILGVIVALLGAFGVGAWAAGMDYLTAWIPESLPMTPVTGFCLFIAGIALLIAQHSSRSAVWVSRALAIVVALISLTVVFLYATN